MDRDWIMHPALNSPFVEKRNNLIPFLDPDRINVINVPGIKGLGRRYDFLNLLERLVILQRVGAPLQISAFQVSKFDAENGSLDAIHPAVPTHHAMVVLANLPVISKDAQLFLQSWVVGHNRARFTKRAKVLARVKAKTSGITKCAGTSPPVFASVGLGRVLDDEEIMVPRELKNWIHVGRLAEQMHWNDGLGARAKRLFKPGRVHRVGGLVNIDKHRPSSTVSNGLGSGHKCIGNGDYFVARPNAARQKREPKRFGPTADADSVPASTIRRKIRLELFDERSAGKGAAVNHLADRAVKLRPESRVVSVKVEKWYSNMHWFSQAQDRGNVPHRGRILGHRYYNCGSGATVAPSPPLPHPETWLRNQRLFGGATVCDSATRGFQRRDHSQSLRRFTTAVSRLRQNHSRALRLK